MPAEPLEVTVDSTNQKIQFTGACRDNAPIHIDYPLPLGDDQGYTPLELLLVSLAACSGATVATLLRKMKKTVAGVQVHARGVRRDVHPTCFERISLELVLTGSDAGDAEIRRAIQLAEESYCPVWVLLKNNCDITVEYHVAAA